MDKSRTIQALLPRSSPISMSLQTCSSPCPLKDGENLRGGEGRRAFETSEGERQRQGLEPRSLTADRYLRVLEELKRPPGFTEPQLWLPTPTPTPQPRPHQISKPLIALQGPGPLPFSLLSVQTLPTSPSSSPAAKKWPSYHGQL